MMRWFMAAGLSCVVVTGTAAAQGSGSAQPPAETKKPAAAQKETTAKKEAGADAMFMRQAAMSNMAEIEHGRQASQNAESDDVKQFAQRMVDDHTKAGDELKGLASEKKVTLPTELSQKHRAMQQKLEKMKGAAFDKAYMANMVTAHQETVALFQKEAKTGTDADTKAWAAKTLPTLQEHLKMARDLNTKMSKTAPAK